MKRGNSVVGWEPVGGNQPGQPRVFRIADPVRAVVGHADLGDVQRGARDGMLDEHGGGFEIDDTRPSWALNLWLTHMVRLFRTDIIRLIRERDVAVADWRAAHPDRDVLEDRELEVTSQMDFSLADAVSELMTQTAS